MDRMLNIIKDTPNNIGGFLQSYYYSRFEIINLKRILRGKISNFTPERINASLISMPPYGVKSYEELVKTKNVEEILQLLEGSNYQALNEKLTDYLQNQSIQPLEKELDHISSSSIIVAANNLPPQERRLVHNIVKLEVDVENFLQAVKIGRNKIESSNFKPSEIFPDTFSIKTETLEKLVHGEKIEDVLETIPPLFKNLLQPITTGDVALIRTRLMSQIYRAAGQSRGVNDFGFNPIMAFLIYCEIEKNNLTSIAWAKEQNIPIDQFFKYLVLPNII
jgi:vacuolar-type H+-ATPase subunit C/Vma6